MSVNYNKICFVLDHNLKEYRVPLFYHLNKMGYEITVMHPGPRVEGISLFKQIITQPQKIFFLYYRNLKNLNSFGVVVFMQNLWMLDLWFHTLRPFKRFKIIHWGIGVSSSNGLTIKRTSISIIRNLLSRTASALILYSSAPLSLFSNKVIAKSFIANNTVESNISKRYSSETKNSIIFIGTLNKRKGLDLLIRAFNDYLNDYKHKTIDKLIIIGDGEEKENLCELVSLLKIDDNVIFTGKITSEEQKWAYFKNSAISVSLKQAGLSVLECFSYGIPFVCFKNAISGGEHLNIQNGKNGYLIESIDELVSLLIKLDKTPELAQKLSQNAFDYYHNERNMSQMSKVFVKAFKFVNP